VAAENLALVAQTTASSVWFWVTILIGLVWLRRHFDLNRGRKEPILRPDEPGVEAGELPALTVLVAAKDEQDNIAICIDGLLAQDYPRLQLVVINDRSADRTAEIIDGRAAREPRLSALHVRELPAGWFGKNNAMHTGVRKSDGEWLCFSDADCTYHSPQLLVAAMRFALRENVEFLSVLPRLAADTFWERVVQPVAGAIMVFWNPPQKVNDPASRCAYANGAFMLVKRSAYETIGGHEPVKATLNEDMHMARRAKRLGVRLRVIRGGGLYGTRMYTGFGPIWRGWSRIFYGCFGTPGRLLASVVMLSVFSVSPYVTLAISLLTGSAFGWLAAAAGFAILGQQSLLWRFYRETGTPGPWALTYPLGALVCLGMTFNALAKAAGAAGTTWRGTAYRGGA
jgi:glycosyltransferase involved in cell wall biosynthesis